MKMKLVYVDPSLKGYKQLYKRLLWQLLLFLLTLTVCALVLQTLENYDNSNNTINSYNSSFNSSYKNSLDIGIDGDTGKQSSYKNSFSSSITHKKSSEDSELIRNFSKHHDVPLVEVQRLISHVTNKNIRNDDRKPNYLEAILTMVSIFFTIGWNNLSPTTIPGTIFVSISTMIGIPITYMLVVTAAKILIRQLQDAVVCLSCGGKNKCNQVVVNRQLLPYLILLFIGYVQVSSLESSVIFVSKKWEC